MTPAEPSIVNTIPPATVVRKRPRSGQLKYRRARSEYEREEVAAVVAGSEWRVLTREGDESDARDKPVGLASATAGADQLTSIQPLEACDVHVQQPRRLWILSLLRRVRRCWALYLR